MPRRSSSSPASVLHEHEETIRRVLGDRDYQLLVRYLSGSVRLLQKIETSTVRVPGRKGSRPQLKISADLSEEARRAFEALSEHLAGALHYQPQTAVGVAARRQLKIVKRGR